MSAAAADRAPLAGLCAAVEALAGEGVADRVAQLDPDDLLISLTEVTAAVGRLRGLQVLLAEQVEMTGAVGATGWASAKDLLTHLLGGRKGSGGGVVRLAEQTAALPAVRSAMLAGEISPDQARTIAKRVTTLPADPAFRSLAAGIMLDQVRESGLDATDLDRAFGDVVSAVDPDGTVLDDERQRPARERAAHRARYFSMTPDEVGGVTVSGYAGVEDAELIRTTLASLAVPVRSEPGSCGGEAGVDWLECRRRRQAGDPVPSCPDPACDHDGRDPRQHGARMLDALVEVCRRVQAPAGGPDALPRAHGTTARVTVTVRLDDLLDQSARLATPFHRRPAEATGVLGSGQQLTATAVRRLACDAEIIPAVLGSAGQVLDLGRSQRLVTPSLWLGVVLRDRHCTFPGCDRPPEACEAHHLVHWADGGATSLDNLALLCRRHHTMTHQTSWAIYLDPLTRRPVWMPPPRSGQPLVGRLCPPVPTSTATPTPTPTLVCRPERGRPSSYAGRPLEAEGPSVQLASTCAGVLGSRLRWPASPRRRPA